MTVAEYQKNTPIVELDFTEERWNDLVNRSSRIFHLDDSTTENIRNHQIIKLVGALPFVAGCRNPMRTALSHISIYLLACLPDGKDVFLHNFSDNDSLFTRLERISHFDGGDKRILDRGMNMLAYAMLGDHMHDKEEDAGKAKYNPLNSGTWDYNKITEQLLADIKAVPCEKLDAIMNVDEGDLRGYWSTN